MARVVILALFGLLAVFYYYFLGAGPTPSEYFDDLEWWRPRGWALRLDALSALRDLTQSESGTRFLPVLIYCIPPIALTVLGFRRFQSALIRTGLLWIGLTLCAFTYYGLLAQRVWQFFEWRFLAVVASFIAVAAVTLFAPSLLRSLAKVPRLAAAATLAALLVGVFLLSTEITGTNSDLRFNISPWPVVTVFGFLFVGQWLASAHLAAGAGLWIWSRLGGAGGVAAGIIAAAVIGGVMTLYVFSEPSPGQISALAIVSATYTLIVGLVAAREPAANSSGGLARIAAGVLLIATFGASSRAAIAYQTTARNDTAQTVLVALEAFKQVQGSYPDRLRELVPDYLPGIPRPVIGLVADEDDRFEYSNYGDSYSLEFASVQWVQCAYSPPYEFAAYGETEEDYWEDDEADTDDGWDLGSTPDVAAPGSETAEQAALRASLREAGLEGSWSCPTEPPKLW